MHPIAPRPTVLAALLLIGYFRALLRLVSPCQARRSRHTRAHPTAVSRLNEDVIAGLQAAAHNERVSQRSGPRMRDQ